MPFVAQLCVAPVQATVRVNHECPRRVHLADALDGRPGRLGVDRVARGLSVVVNTLDPDIFIIGGGMSNVDELYDSLPGAIARYTFSTVFETATVRATPNPEANLAIFITRMAIG